MSLQAQSPPDAGALRQQIERDLQTPLPGRATPLRPAEPAPLKLPEGATLTVQSFRFAGNTLLDSARLQAAVQPFVGRTLGFRELMQATQAVAAVYRQAGWIVRAYLPQQDVTDGVVTIQIVEAVFSGARVEEPQPQRVAAARIVGHMLAQQPLGQPLNADALDRALLLADDLPGVGVTGALEPGQRDGETGIVLSARDEPPVQGDIGLDNAGARSTGAARAMGSIVLQSPLGLGDQLRAQGLHSRGTNYARLSYHLPVGLDGLRVGANATYFDYKLVGSEFAALQGSGDSTSAGVDLRYPLIRSRLRNLYATAEYEHRSYHNEAANAVQSDYSVGALSLGLSGNLYDDLGGGGANQFVLTWTLGRVAHGTPDVAENPVLAGGFGKLRYQLARQQVLAPSLALYGSLNGQYAGRDLDSSERFYLGGPNGVRAYPVSEGGGSRATLANLELRWRAHEGVLASLFYDWGRARQEDADSATTLKGYGVSLAWSTALGFEARATVAMRHGDNPHPTTTGKDQDGSLKKPRFWFQATFAL